MYLRKSLAHLRSRAMAAENSTLKRFQVQRQICICVDWNFTKGLEFIYDYTLMFKSIYSLTTSLINTESQNTSVNSKQNMDWKKLHKKVSIYLSSQFEQGSVRLGSGNSFSTHTHTPATLSLSAVPSVFLSRSLSLSVSLSLFLYQSFWVCKSFSLSILSWRLSLLSLLKKQCSNCSWNSPIFSYLALRNQWRCLWCFGPFAGDEKLEKFRWIQRDWYEVLWGGYD